jgi:hypothetical protein
MVPLKIGIWQRDRDGHALVPGGLICHADAGSQGGFNWLSQHLDRGGVSWLLRIGRRSSVMCRRGCGGSGVLIVHCGRRCVLLGGRSRRGLFSDSSGA